METRFSYALVGLFVILLSIALIGAVLWFGTGFGGVDYKVYRVDMKDSVAGLTVDSPVKYNGVDVGRVKTISLNPQNLDRVRLLLEVQDEVPVKQDTTAELRTQGLLGIDYINLSGGSREAPLLTARPGEKYPVIETRPSLLGRAEDIFTSLSAKLEQVAVSLNELMNEENRKSFSISLKNIEEVSSALAGKSDEIVSSFEDFAVILDNFRETSSALPPLLEQIERSVRSVEQMTEDVKDVSKTVSDTVLTTGNDVQRFTGQALPEASAIVIELRQTSENLRRITEELARNPSAILFGAPESEEGPGE